LLEQRVRYSEIGDSLERPVSGLLLESLDRVDERSALRERRPRVSRRGGDEGDSFDTLREELDRVREGVGSGVILVIKGMTFKSRGDGKFDVYGTDVEMSHPYLGDVSYSETYDIDFESIGDESFKIGEFEVDPEIADLDVVGYSAGEFEEDDFETLIGAGWSKLTSFNRFQIDDVWFNDNDRVSVEVTVTNPEVKYLYHDLWARDDDDSEQLNESEDVAAKKAELRKQIASAKAKARKPAKGKSGDYYYAVASRLQKELESLKESEQNDDTAAKKIELRKQIKSARAKAQHPAKGKSSDYYYAVVDRLRKELESLKESEDIDAFNADRQMRRKHNRLSKSAELRQALAQGLPAHQLKVDLRSMYDNLNDNDPIRDIKRSFMMGDYDHDETWNRMSEECEELTGDDIDEIINDWENERDDAELSMPDPNALSPEDGAKYGIGYYGRRGALHESYYGDPVDEIKRSFMMGDYDEDEAWRHMSRACPELTGDDIDEIISNWDHERWID
jgi:hypothetical protein